MPRKSLEEIFGTQSVGAKVTPQSSGRKSLEEIFGKPGQTTFSMSTTQPSQPSAGGVLENPQTFAGKAVKTASDVGQGILKGMASTFKGASSLGEQALRGVARTVLPESAETRFGINQNQPTSAEQVIPKEMTEAEGTAQKVGKTVEQIGELFIPIPALKGVGVGKGLVNTGKFAVKEGVELAGKRAVQTGGDEKEVRNALLGGALGGAVGKVLLEPVINITSKALSKGLERLNLRLTPVQKQNLGKTVDDVVEVVQKNKIMGSPERRLEVVNDLYHKQEETLQKFLSSPEAKARTVSRENVIQQLEGLKQKYQFDRDVLAIEKQIDSVIDTFKTKWVDDMPLDQLNRFKRTTYENAYNKAGDKVLDGVEHDIGDVIRLNIENSSKGLRLNNQEMGVFNQEYGKIINARKLLKIASTRKEIGFIGKLLVTAIAGSLGSTTGGVGAVLGMMAAQPVANVVAGTAARSLISQGLLQIAKLPTKEAEQAIVRILLPLLQNQSSNQ